MSTNDQVCIIANQCFTQFGTTNIHKVLNVPTNASLSSMKATIRKILQLGQRKGIYTHSQLETVDKFYFLLRNPITFLDYILLPQVRAEYSANDKLVDSRMKTRQKLFSKMLHLTCKLEKAKKELQEAKELIEIKDKLLRLRGLLDKTTIKTAPKQLTGSSSYRPNTPVSPQNEPQCTPLPHFVPFNLEDINVNYTPLWNGEEDKKLIQFEIENGFASRIHMEDVEIQADIEINQLVTHSIDLNSNDLKEFFNVTNEKLAVIADQLAIESEKNRQVISNLEVAENNLAHVQEKIDLIQCQVKIQEKLNQLLETSLKYKEEENRKLLLFNELLKNRLLAIREEDIQLERVQYDDTSLILQSLMFFILIILSMVPLVWAPQF